MDMEQFFLLAMTPPLLMAYVCRLAMLHPTTNTPGIVVMHAALAMSVGWAGYHGWVGDSTFGDVVSVIGAAAWILSSFREWRFGEVPARYKTQPMPLDPIHYPKVSGGKDQ